MGVGAGFPGTPCLPQDPPEKHLERRPCPIPRTSHSSQTDCPPHLFPTLQLPAASPARHTHPPTLRGVGKQKGAGSHAFPGREPRNWTRRGTETAQEGGVGHSLTAGGCGAWVRDGGQLDTSSSRVVDGSANDSQKSAPGQPGVEAEAPPRSAAQPQEEAQALGVGWAGELAGTVQN